MKSLVRSFQRCASLVAGFLFSGAAAAQTLTPEVEPNNGALTASFLPLPSGFGLAGAAIQPAGDIDFFRFLAPAGARAWLYVDTGGVNEAGKDSVLRLIASDGSTVLEEDDDDGTGNGCDSTVENQLSSAIAGRVLTGEGTYYAEVVSFDNEEPIERYKLFVALTTFSPTAEVEPNDTPATAQALTTLTTPLGLRSGALSTAGDADVYAVVAGQGSILFISADCDPERNGGTDVAIDLIAPDQTTVILTADSSETAIGAAEAFCYLVQVTGTYYVRVYSAAGATGTYHLMATSQGPGSFQFGASVYTQLESGGSITVPVLRAGGSVRTVNVQCVSSNGTAAAGLDYSAVSQMLTFPDGVTTQFVSVTIAQDMLIEANETFQLHLIAPTGGATVGAPRTATVVIIDDDETPDNAPANATALDLSSGLLHVQVTPDGTPLQISPGGDQDWFSFIAPPGATLWALLDTGGAPNPGADSRDSVLTLYAADGATVIEEDDDDGSGSGCTMVLPADGGSDSAIAGRLLQSGGLYYLRVKAFSPSEIISSYSLMIVLTTENPVSEGEPNNAPGFATTLLTASSATAQRLAQIGSPADIDFFAVLVPPNALLYVAADCDPERDGTSTDLVIDLFSTDGSTPLFTADSSGQGANAAEAFCVRLSAPGIYFVRVRHVSAAGTGTYRILAARTPVDVEPNNAPASAVMLAALNQFAHASGSISPGGDTDYFSLVATPGAKVWLTVDTGGVQRNAANSRDSVLTLFDSDGATVLEQDDNDGTGNGLDGIIETSDASAIAGATLVTGGNYFVRVAANGAGVIAPYTLYAVTTTAAPTAESEPNNLATQATPLLTEAPAIGLRAGTIGTAGDVDLYSIYAGAGNVLHVSADGDPERDGVGTDLQLDLLGPTGAVLLSVNSSGAGSLVNPPAEAFCFLAPTSGRYLLRVVHAAGGLGSYHVMAARDATQLRVLTINRVGSDIFIRFPTELGRNYLVERLQTLVGPPIWTALPGSFTGNGQIMTAFDQGSGLQPHIFYRVRQIP